MGVNGTVSAVVPAGPVTYIAGGFSRVGPATKGGATDVTTGRRMEGPAVSRGPVHAVIPDRSGGWFIGGDFTHVRDEPRNGLAHLAADGSVTAWNPAPSGSVRTLARSGMAIYVGGGFTSVGGQTRNRLAALDATTAAAIAWNPDANGTVNTLAASASGRSA